jgi:hypothetical protein
MAEQSMRPLPRSRSRATSAMRADLIVIPLRDIDNICEPCLEAFCTNLQASFPKTEEDGCGEGWSLRSRSRL